MLQCILNVFDEEERIHILQAEEAEEIEAFAGIVTGSFRYFLEAYLWLYSRWTNCLHHVALSNSPPRSVFATDKSKKYMLTYRTGIQPGPRMQIQPKTK